MRVSASVIATRTSGIDLRRAKMRFYIMKKKIFTMMTIFAMTVSMLSMAGCGKKEEAETETESVASEQTTFTLSEAVGDSSVVTVSDVNALQPEAVAGLDIDAAINNNKKCYAGDEVVYVSPDRSVFCSEDSKAADIAQNMNLQGATVEQVYKGYYLGSDGYLRNSAGDMYFQEHNITFFDVSDSNDDGALEAIYAVTANGEMLYCTSDNSTNISTAMYGVRYVSVIENAMVLATMQDASCTLCKPSFENYTAAEEYDFSGLDVSGWTNIKWAVLGEDTSDGERSFYAVGLTVDGKVLGTGDYPEEVDSWENMVYINTLGTKGVYGITADGSVLVAGDDTYGISRYENVIALDARTGDDRNMAIVDIENGYGKVDLLKHKYVVGASGIAEADFFTQIVPEGGYITAAEEDSSDELEMASDQDENATENNSSSDTYDSYDSDNSYGSYDYEEDDSSDSYSDDSYYYDPFAEGNAIGKVID